MSSKAMKYGQLYNYLESLGYKAQIIEKHIVFKMPHRELPVILPKAAKTEEVRASHLAAVERILVLDGIVSGGHLPSATRPTFSAIKTSAGKLAHVKAADTKSALVKSSMGKASQFKAANTKATQVKAANTKAAQVKATNTKAAQVKAVKAKSSN